MMKRYEITQCISTGGGYCEDHTEDFYLADEVDAKIESREFCRLHLKLQQKRIKELEDMLREGISIPQSDDGAMHQWSLDVKKLLNDDA
jgi:hypothetical protein